MFDTKLTWNLFHSVKIYVLPLVQYHQIIISVFLEIDAFKVVYLNQPSNVLYDQYKYTILVFHFYGIYSLYSRHSYYFSINIL